MTNIANTLISALSFARRNQTATARYCIETSPMRQLSAEELRDVAGGDETGPRGGWKAAVATTVA